MGRFGTDQSNTTFHEKKNTENQEGNTNLRDLAASKTEELHDSEKRLEPAIDNEYEKKIEVTEGPRRGRRYRALSGTQNVPIKIKKMIPLKETPKKDE